jgi:two-component system, NarL family, nitrate/nitrite response regulator NarL
MDKKICIVVVDEDPIMRDGIVSAFGFLSSTFDVIGSGGSAREAIRLADELKPDMMLLGLKITSQIKAATTQICTSHPSLRLVIFTVSELATEVVAAFDLGAKGYILKGITSAELVKALLSVWDGNTYVSPELAGKILAPNSKATSEQIAATGRLRALSEREISILELLNRGKTNRDIAKHLAIGEKTVKYYLTLIFGKLAVKNRLEAVVFFRDTNQSVNL